MKQTTNALLFMMQVITAVFAHALSTAQVPTGAELAPSYLSVLIGGDAHDQVLTASSASNLPATPPEHWTLEKSWMHPSSQTEPDTFRIKQRRPSSTLCGLDGCAMKQNADPLLFMMQVSKTQALFAKTTSNHCLVQLPSQQCCVNVVIECLETVGNMLLLSGDIETNPGPHTTHEVLAELKKLSSAQATLISDVQDIKTI